MVAKAEFTPPEFPGMELHGKLIYNKKIQKTVYFIYLCPNANFNI